MTTRFDPTESGILLTKFMVMINRLPRPRPNQLLAQFRQLRRLIIRFFPSPCIHGETAGSGAVAPGVDAGFTLRFVLRAGREHADVLGQARLIRVIAPVAVEQASVPDDQITRFATQVFNRQPGDVGAA